MLLRIGYDIIFHTYAPTSMILLLYTHPSLASKLKHPDRIHTEPEIPIHTYIDSFGNQCGRIVAPSGRLRLWNDTIIESPDHPDVIRPEAGQLAIEDLPDDTLLYLLASRYCEVDRLVGIAWELFADTPPGWARVQAICDWVHSHVTFDYNATHPNKSAWDVYAEGTGVCRDFQHLAITFCRAMNIPARYVAGYIGDIRIPPVDHAMDFHAWFEVYLDGQWYPFDARFNTPRYGRTLMARGRDAVDVALTTQFGASRLDRFTVITEEINPPDLPKTADVASLAPNLPQSV